MMFDETLKRELTLRWNRIQTLIRAQEADGLLVASNVNNLYVSGRIFRGYTYIPAQGEPLFFVRRPEGLTGSIDIRKPADMVPYIQGRKILLEGDTLPYAEYIRLASLFPGVEAANGSGVLRQARMVKTPFEVEQLRRSCAVHAAAYADVPSLYRPGMTDLDLSIELDRSLRRHGSLGLTRINGSTMEFVMSSVLAGENADAASPYDFATTGAGVSVTFPVGANGTVIAGGMTVMTDGAANATGYISDMTRIFSVGQLPDLAYRAHETALAIQQAMTERLTIGTPAAGIYEMASAMASEAGLSDYFMGHRQQAAFVGHGIGLELNEGPVFAPRSKERMEAGMTFAFEPKFVIPHVGVTGIENSFVLRVDGKVEKLSLLPETIVPLE